MSDESPANSEEPAESPTVPDATPAGSPAPADPAAAGPAPAEPVTAEHVAAAPDEAPTEATPPAAAAPSPAPAAAAPADRGRGVFVPAWVAVVVGVLVVAGLGFLIGWIAAPGDDTDPSNAVAATPSTPNVPSTPNGSSGSAGNDDTGGTRGNGNGSGNGNGNSSDDDRTLPRLLPGAYLGVAVDPTPNDTGATITDVGADSPADDAGLREGDVITAVDDTDITSALDLVREIRAHDVDDTVTITYTRDGTSSTAEVTLTSRPASQPVS